MTEQPQVGVIVLEMAPIQDEGETRYLHPLFVLEHMSTAGFTRESVFLMLANFEAGGNRHVYAMVGPDVAFDCGECGNRACPAVDQWPGFIGVGQAGDAVRANTICGRCYHSETSD